MGALALGVLFAGAGEARGQANPADGTVRGQVLDAATGSPVVAATVDVLDQVGRIRSRATTDEQGAFLHTRLHPGEFRIRVRHVGYEEVTSPRWWIETGEVLTVVLRVDAQAVLLAPLEVIARSRVVSPVLAGFHERMRRGLGGVYFGRADIEARNPMRITDLLAEVPGLRLQGSSSFGDPRRDEVVTFSRALPGAGGPCPVQVFLDGVPANRRGTEVPLDALASPGILEGIEVYRGLSGVPPEFLSPEARCGVVALWTRRGGSEPNRGPGPGNRDP
jgi:hypothetical protein